ALGLVRNRLQAMLREVDDWETLTYSTDG
ncbi:short-chain dehydrogenase/reductase, partial [Thioclava sp. BHET1]